MRGDRRFGWVAWLGVGSLLVGCARPGVPPGGQPPAVPPSVVASAPAPFSTADGTRSAVEIRYNRPLSERGAGGALENLVEVSPRLGEVGVRTRGNALEIAMEGGFPAGRVYRITVLPGIRDLYGNATRDPFELVFSTGGEFHANVVAGVVEDRITGQVMGGVRVEGRVAGDTVPHSALTDDDGVFALRFLPPGGLEVVAYQDRARTFEPDFTDPQDSTRVQLAEADTVMLFDLALLLPDTTPAQLGAVQAEDSVTLRLTFDDHLDPEWDLAGVQLRVMRDDGPAPGVARLLHPHERDSILVAQREEAARLEEEARLAEQEARAQEERDLELEETEEEETEEEETEEEETEVDERLQEALERELPPDPGPGVRAPPGDTGPPRPQPILYALLDGPLEPDAEYRVEVSGIRNLNGLGGGGGEAPFRAPPAPELPPDIPPDVETPPEHEGPSAGETDP